MALKLSASCVSHPGNDVVARCRQCTKPVCGLCVVVGPTGKFCSDTCREQHEQFMRSAQQQDLRKDPHAGLFTHFRRFVMKLVMYAVALLALATVLTHLEIVDIPVVGDIINRYLDKI